MRHFRVWIFFALVSLGIVAVRLSPSLQNRFQALFSGYGMLAVIVVTVLLTVIYRSILGRGKRDPESDHTPWWY